MLVNSTNQTVEGLLNVVTTASGISPDILYLAPSLVILGFFCLFLYMAESRRDLGYTAVVVFVSFLAYSDSLLSSIAYQEMSVLNLPFLMFLIGMYEMLMTFLLLTEAKKRIRDEERKEKENE
jgi:hypothetical protein